MCVTLLIFSPTIHYVKYFHVLKFEDRNRNSPSQGRPSSFTVPNTVSNHLSITQIQLKLSARLLSCYWKESDELTDSGGIIVPHWSHTVRNIDGQFLVLRVSLLLPVCPPMREDLQTVGFSPLPLASITGEFSNRPVESTSSSFSVETSHHTFILIPPFLTEWSIFRLLVGILRPFYSIFASLSCKTTGQIDNTIFRVLTLGPDE